VFRKIMIGALASFAVTLSIAAFAQNQRGTAAEAKAMLEKAVAAVQADKEKALAMFNKGEGGFKDRDLQPFCFNISDGKIVATTVPNLLGTDIWTLKDNAGKEFGKEGYQSAVEGKSLRPPPISSHDRAQTRRCSKRLALLRRSATSGAALGISSSRKPGAQCDSLEAATE
jgi:hypothetical protein